MIVYRMQDAEGRGPYRPGFSQYWVEDRSDHDNLLTWMQEFARYAIPSRGYFGCGCRTLEQLRRWFIESEYETLLRYGFQAVEMDVARVLYESEIQLIFQRARPLRIGVEVLDLYGANVGATT